ncbi:MAG: hypothetical protein IJT54_04065 [Candidatus Methanomethylophilaceae archaeon]|nr:hypothetical protein [Candidatus Methanomethylophilaceae archaeon]
MRAWRLEYGLELLQKINDDPGRVPSHYIKQFEYQRRAFLRYNDLWYDGLIEVHEEEGYGRKTLTVTDKGRRILELAEQMEEVYTEGRT